MSCCDDKEPLPPLDDSGDLPPNAIACMARITFTIREQARRYFLAEQPVDWQDLSKEERHAHAMNVLAVMRGEYAAESPSDKLFGEIVRAFRAVG